MPHCGMILASVRNSFFAIERSAIARNYSVHDVLSRLRFAWMNGLRLADGPLTADGFLEVTRLQHRPRYLQRHKRIHDTQRPFNKSLQEPHYPSGLLENVYRLPNPTPSEGLELVFRARRTARYPRKTSLRPLVWPTQ
jgi:hypothetical protein